jgi:predicted transcriptional regulator YdeE
LQESSHYPDYRHHAANSQSRKDEIPKNIDVETVESYDFLVLQKGKNEERQSDCHI